jgi:uncharacterized protein YqgQ
MESEELPNLELIKKQAYEEKATVLRKKHQKEK